MFDTAYKSNSSFLCANSPTKTSGASGIHVSLLNAQARRTQQSHDMQVPMSVVSVGHGTGHEQSPCINVDDCVHNTVHLLRKVEGDSMP